MNDSHNIQRDTPLRRFNTVVWGLALFGVFGLASVIAYWSIDRCQTAYALNSEERIKVVKDVNETQAKLLAQKETDKGIIHSLKVKQKRTEKFAPGTPSYEKANAVPVPTDGASLDGQKVFMAKTCFTCHGNDGKSPIAPIYPVISGKEADYLAQKMKDIKSGKHVTALTPLMLSFISVCSDEEIEAMSQWLSTVQ